MLQSTKVMLALISKACRIAVEENSLDTLDLTLAFMTAKIAEIRALEGLNK